MRINRLYIIILCLALIPASVMAHGGSKKTAEGTGIIHRIDQENETLYMTTEPMAKLGWSEMTMDWKVAENVKINHLSAGDQVKFSIKQTNSRLTYHITHIEIIN